MKRSLYLLTLLASLLLTGITAAAAPPFPIHPVTPITFCGTACLKNPPPAPLRYRHQFPSFPADGMDQQQS